MKCTPPMLPKTCRSSSDASLEYPGWEWAEPVLWKSIGSIQSMMKLWESPNTVPGSMTISSMMPPCARCRQMNSSG